MGWKSSPINLFQTAFHQEHRIFVEMQSCHRYVVIEFRVTQQQLSLRTCHTQLHANLSLHIGDSLALSEVYNTGDGAARDAEGCIEWRVRHGPDSELVSVDSGGG